MIEISIPVDKLSLIEFEPGRRDFTDVRACALEFGDVGDEPGELGVRVSLTLSL